MLWDDFKSITTDNRGKPVLLGYKDYVATLSECERKIDAIKVFGSYGDFYFVRDGDIFFNPYDTKKLIKITHITISEGYEKMCKIIEALGSI